MIEPFLLKLAVIFLSMGSTIELERGSTLSCFICIIMAIAVQFFMI